MKKLIKLSGVFLLMLILAVIVFLYKSLTLYQPPLTQFISMNEKQSFEPFVEIDSKLSCYRPMLDAEAISTTQPLKLLVWNVHKGEDQGWQSLLLNYEEKTDFMLLQEATSLQKLPQLLQHMPNQLFASGFAYRDMQSGVATLSPFSPQYYCSAAVDEPWLAIPKTSVSSVYPLDNGKFLLMINVHMVNFEWGTSAYRQQLEQIMQQLQQSVDAVIIAGDFNAWNQERVAILQQKMAQFGLHEISFSPDNRLRFNGFPLDHIFVKGLKAVSATTKKTKASDHNPMWVELTFD